MTRFEQVIALIGGVVAVAVPVNKWGPFFNRSIQLPTSEIAVEVRLPRELSPSLVGIVKNSLMDLEEPLDIGHVTEGEYELFSWNGSHPHLHSQINFRWSLTYARAD